VSKGDTPRPLSISKKQFDENWLRTFGRLPSSAEVPQEDDPRYKDWRSAYEADKRRGKGYRGK
jgi:hypothetical protein